MSGSRDFFGFDEQPLGPAEVPEDIQAADDKTLRLASPELTHERLEGFVRYLTAFCDRLEAIPLGEAAAHLASCHEQSLKESGLNRAWHHRISALVADFAAKRGTVLKLREKLAGLGGNGDPELVEKITTELGRLDSLTALERRYGVDAISLLMEREAELVALQTRATRLVASR